MADCFDVEAREMLPELAAGQLDAASRARVEAHLGNCSACADDLDVLLAVRQAVIPAPAMNVARIVRALPSAPVAMPEELPWYRHAALQLAASLVLVVGGLVAVRQAGDRVEVSDTPVTSLVAPRPEAPSVHPPGIALVSGLDELNSGELTTLLNAVDNIAALPVAEPEVFAPVNALGSKGEN